MELVNINERIKSEFDDEIITKLADINLLDEYRNSSSTKQSIRVLENVLEKNLIPQDTIKSIINDYILELVPAGTKGVIRGNKFNQIIKTIIENMKLDTEKFDVCFEKQCMGFETNEKPDWYIKSKGQNEKVLIGMNQLDLWNGGAQLNRGAKYILESKNTENRKLLCVVCNKIEIKTEKSKAFKLFEKGFIDDTLCYPNNLANIIKKYFVISNEEFT
jgi:hypothetical protein